jgi:hypothetical protein
LDDFGGGNFLLVGDIDGHALELDGNALSFGKLPLDVHEVVFGDGHSVADLTNCDSMRQELLGFHLEVDVEISAPSSQMLAEFQQSVGCHTSAICRPVEPEPAQLAYRYPSILHHTRIVRLLPQDAEDDGLTFDETLVFFHFEGVVVFFEDEGADVYEPIDIAAVLHEVDGEGFDAEAIGPREEVAELASLALHPFDGLPGLRELLHRVHISIKDRVSRFHIVALVSIL